MFYVWLGFTNKDPIQHTHWWLHAPVVECDVTQWTAAPLTCRLPDHFPRLPRPGQGRASVLLTRACRAFLLTSQASLALTLALGDLDRCRKAALAASQALSSRLRTGESCFGKLPLKVGFPSRSLCAPLRRPAAELGGPVDWLLGGGWWQGGPAGREGGRVPAGRAVRGGREPRLD